MVKRIAAVITALLLIPAAALAGLQWREDTPALSILKNYTESINKLLTETGEQPINSLFSCYPAEAVMGITAEDNAEIPEGVEITVELYYETLNSLQLRVSDPDRFPGIAAAIVRALYGEAMTQDDAISIPADRAKRAKNEPNASFEEPVDEMNGTSPRVYYAYFPNQYRDGVNWLQMTLIFPLAGEWDGTSLTVGTEQDSEYVPEDADPDYEGYQTTDDYTHFEVFATATPEPDSAAAEYDFR